MVMRILQLIDSASVGGAEENTALLSQELARRGHAILLASPDGPYTDRFDALEGVETVRLPLRDGIPAARTALALTIRGWAPDLVHSHMLRADVVLALQDGRARYRRATTIHNMFNLEVPSPLRRGLYRLLAAWAYRRFDAILPVSHFVARYLRRYLWVGDKRVRVVAGPRAYPARG